MPSDPRFPLHRRLLPVPVAVGAILLLSACATSEATDPPPAGTDEDVHVRTQPVDEVQLRSDLPGPVSLAEGPTTVTFSWDGIVDGSPVSHRDCVGMVALTSPDGHLITLDPALRSCSGSTELLLDAAGTGQGDVPGDYRIEVMINGLKAQLIFPVTA